jgi:hypothetical protein
LPGSPGQANTDVLADTKEKAKAGMSARAPLAFARWADSIVGLFVAAAFLPAAL